MSQAFGRLTTSLSSALRSQEPLFPQITLLTPPAVPEFTYALHELSSHHRGSCIPGRCPFFCNSLPDHYRDSKIALQPDSPPVNEGAYLTFKSTQQHVSYICKLTSKSILSDSLTTTHIDKH